MDVMFYEAFAEEKEAIRKMLPSEIHAQFTPLTIQEKNDESLPAKIISVRTQSHIPHQWSKELEAVLTRSQGYDHLKKFREESGANQIAYGYLEEYCSRAVAEQAILMMLALSRKLNAQQRCFKEFKRDYLTGKESRGKKILIVGVGKIGKEILDMALGLKMIVKGVDIGPKYSECEYVSLEEGIKWANVIFCATPLTKKTNAMFNYEKVKNAQKGIYLINIARGELTPIMDMKRLLDESILGGLAMDVYEREAELANYLRNPEKNKKEKSVETVLELQKRDNVIFTPHNAFNTKEALERKASLSVESVVSFLEKGRFFWEIPKD